MKSYSVMDLNAARQHNSANTSRHLTGIFMKDKPEPGDGFSRAAMRCNGGPVAFMVYPPNPFFVA